jgi:hypothetical protein
MLGRILAAHPDGVTAEVIAAVRAAASVGALDFSGLDEATRSSVAESLDAWTVLAGPERPPNLEELLASVLRLLGITQRAVNRPPALRAASTGDYFFVEVEGTDAGPYAYVPDYGSRAAGRRRLMLCFTDTLPVSQLWSLARANSLDDQPMYVLYFRTLSARARVELAGVGRRSNTKGLVVFDAAVLLRCAVEGRQTWDVPMRATLPYAAPNPYDPDLLAGVPPEMFYGRRRERESLKDFDGTSIISGGRRFGKTALLRSALGELQRSDPDLVGMLIGIQNIGAEPRNDPAELWPRVAAALVGAKVLPADTDGSADAVYAGIQAWLAANERKRLMLLLDECDSFLRADADHGFGNVALLRDLMGGAERRFKVVFSGLQHVARYNRLPNQPLTHFAEPLVIGPLDATSASKLVRRPLHAVGWAISDAQVDRIVTYCACNPAVIQLTCAALINRLRATEPTELAPWGVDDTVIDTVLGSKEIADGVSERLFHTLNLDDRYKLLAYMLAERALTDGLAQAVPPTELRRMAISWWPEGFDSEGADDVRNLCEELVGLGIFAGDASGGYRMLSPGTIRVFGDAEKINEELHWASERYVPTRAVDAAGSRMRLEVLGPQRYSPLTATQLADVLGVGSTQLRIVVGSRATRVDAVYSALAAAQALYPKLETREARTLREWRERMRAPESGHLVVVSDMTSRVHQDSWEESIALARRRGATRTARGTRAAVLVAGPSERWLLRRLVTLPDGTAGDLSGEAVALHRVDAPALQAWDRIDDLDLALPVQRRLLEVTGGWPSLIERVLSARADVGLSAALNAMEAELAEPAGARRLVAAVGLDLGDEDQPADPGLVATFDWLVDAAFAAEPLDYLADLLGEADDLRGEDNPAEAVAILALLGALAEAEPGRFGVEPRLTAAWRLLAPAAAS